MNENTPLSDEECYNFKGRDAPRGYAQSAWDFARKYGIAPRAPEGTPKENLGVCGEDLRLRSWNRPGGDAWLS